MLRRLYALRVQHRPTRPLETEGIRGGELERERTQVQQGRGGLLDGAQGGDVGEQWRAVAARPQALARGLAQLHAPERVPPRHRQLGASQGRPQARAFQLRLGQRLAGKFQNRCLGHLEEQIADLSGARQQPLLAGETSATVGVGPMVRARQRREGLHASGGHLQPPLPRVPDQEPRFTAARLQPHGCGTLPDALRQQRTQAHLEGKPREHVAHCRGHGEDGGTAGAGGIHVTGHRVDVAHLEAGGRALVVHHRDLHGARAAEAVARVARLGAGDHRTGGHGGELGEKRLHLPLSHQILQVAGELPLTAAGILRQHVTAA